MAGFLGALEYVLEEGPRYEWLDDDTIFAVAIVSAVSAVVFFARVLTARAPIVDLRAFANRNFAVGSLFSFVLGIGLYGLTYLAVDRRADDGEGEIALGLGQRGPELVKGARGFLLLRLEHVEIGFRASVPCSRNIAALHSYSISVDALPGHAIAGHVASLSPASGAVFSLLPPDNATGNFTKIVQRLPVRIEVPADVAAKQMLRPGMSVVVSVNTKPAKSATKTALAGDGN